MGMLTDPLTVLQVLQVLERESEESCSPAFPVLAARWAGWRRSRQILKAELLKWKMWHQERKE